MVSVVVVVEGSCLLVRTLQTNFGFMNSLQGGEIPASPGFLLPYFGLCFRVFHVSWQILSMPQVFEQSLFLFFPLTKSGLLPVWSDFAHGIEEEEEEEEEEKEEAEFMNSKAGKRLPARSCKLHSR